MIRHVECGEMFPVRICPPRPNENGMDVAALRRSEIGGKCYTHAAVRMAGKGQMIVRG